VLVAAVLALSIGAALLGRAGAKTRAALRLAGENYDQSQAHLKQAEANYQIAREAVDRYYNQVSEETLLNQPRMERLRRKLLETAREFYQKLLDQQEGHPESRADLASAHGRLAMIDDRIGAPAGAIEHGRQSAALFAQLDAERPGTVAYRDGLADALNVLGLLELSSGQIGPAEEHLKRTAALHEALSRDDPRAVEYRNGLGMGLNNLGTLYLKLGRLDEAESCLRRVIETFEALVREGHGGALLRYELAGAYHNAGSLDESTGRVARAEERYKKAIAIQEAVVREHPDVLDYQLFLSRHYVNLGNLAYHGSRRDEAASWLRKALAIREDLASEHAEVVDFRDGLANVCNSLGNIELDDGRPELAERSYRRALDFWQALAETHPDQGEFRYRLGTVRYNLGRLCRGRGDRTAACDWFGRSAEPLEEVLRRRPDDAVTRALLLRVLHERAAELFELGRPGEAAEAWGRAVQLADGPARDVYRINRATALAKSGDPRRALAEADAIAAVGPKSGEVLYNLACIYSLASAAERDDRATSEAVRRRGVACLSGQALALLRSAHDVGFFDEPGRLELLETDPDLDPIRSHEGYPLLRADLTFPTRPFVGAEDAGRLPATHRPSERSQARTP
jgi:tetratricopeptide (TPR) repeat protein